MMLLQNRRKISTRTVGAPSQPHRRAKKEIDRTHALCGAPLYPRGEQIIMTKRKLMRKQQNQHMGRTVTHTHDQRRTFSSFGEMSHGQTTGFIFWRTNRDIGRDDDDRTRTRQSFGHSFTSCPGPQRWALRHSCVKTKRCLWRGSSEAVDANEDTSVDHRFISADSAPPLAPNVVRGPERLGHWISNYQITLFVTRQGT